MMLRQIVKLNRNAANWLVEKYPKFFSGPSYKNELDDRIAREIESIKPQTILEVGGIDRPLLSRGHGYEYIGLDIEEQPTCYEIYDQFIVRSIEEPLDLSADMIVSITLLEHVPNNNAAFQTMYEVLRPGGTMLHYLPSKWHPYSIALRLVGPRLQKRLIAILRPDAVGVTGYPAFFDHCSPAEFETLLERQGFVDIDIVSYYRATDYFAFFLPAYVLVTLFENICSFFNFRFFASGFVVTARKAK
jgi:SAM-dependent methyltransferase